MTFVRTVVFLDIYSFQGHSAHSQSRRPHEGLHKVGSLLACTQLPPGWDPPSSAVTVSTITDHGGSRMTHKTKKLLPSLCFAWVSRISLLTKTTKNVL